MYIGYICSSVGKIINRLKINIMPKNTVCPGILSTGDLMWPPPLGVYKLSYRKQLAIH